MELILKSSNGVTISLSGKSAEDLLKVSQLCNFLDISYGAVRQRLLRGESVDQAIDSLLRKQGGE